MWPVCPTQRIGGENVQPQLRFFGQAIDGDMDLGEDGLPDLVIGSQGAAVVLRYSPPPLLQQGHFSKPFCLVGHL